MASEIKDFESYDLVVRAECVLTEDWTFRIQTSRSCGLKHQARPREQTTFTLQSSLEHPDTP
eukprot:2415366-Amphidinium_carterae.2